MSPKKITKKVLKKRRTFYAPMAKSIMTLCLKEIVHWNQWVSYFPTKLMTYTEKVMSLSSINLVKMVISHGYQCNSYCTRRSSCKYFIWFAKDGDSVCFMYDMMKALLQTINQGEGHFISSIYLFELLTISKKEDQL